MPLHFGLLSPGQKPDGEQLEESKSLVIWRSFLLESVGRLTARCLSVPICETGGMSVDLPYDLDCGDT